MEKIFFSIIYFFALFLISLIVFLFINKKRKTYRTGKFYGDIDYLIKCGNIDLNKTSYKTVRRWTTILDSVVIAFSCSVLIHIESFLLKIGVGFALLIVLLYSLYNIVGKIIKKREKKKKK